MKYEDFEAVIGLEIHIQIKTESKIFCQCPNKYGSAENSNTCPICLGHPGVLPVLNERAVEKMVKAGLMTDCTIARNYKFDRKSYFYPDQPKNYQITQLDMPLCSEGRIPIWGIGLSGKQLEDKFIRMERIHLEEDVAKSTHKTGYSIVDFNRAGVPLMETVSHPDISNADEAYAYMQSLQQIMRYGKISDCDQEKGQLRCDVNISVRPKGQKELGTKVEIKNLNSNRHVYNSINYEFKRQVKAVLAGEKITQETRRWDVDKNKTIFMRSKETANDYRYFPEPNLPLFSLNEEKITEIKKSLPLTPKNMYDLFIEKYGLSAYDSHVLTNDKDLALFFYDCVQKGENAKGIANIMMNILVKELVDSNLSISEAPVTPEHICELVDLIDKKVISSRICQQVVPEMIKTGEAPQKIVEEKGLVQVTDDSAIEGFVQEAIDKNAKVVAEFRAGKETALQFLVGQVMRFSRGKANPQMAIEKLKEKLK